MAQSGHRAIRPGGELLRRKVCVGHAHRRAGHRDCTRRTGRVAALAEESVGDLSDAS
jgi:hypothetical protein